MIRKPTEAAWSTWKEFIFRNFITGNRAIAPALIPKEPTITPQSIIPMDTFEIQLAQLDVKYKQILGDIKYNIMEQQRLVDSIRNGQLICGCDASVIEEMGICKGTHAYSLQDHNHDYGRIYGTSFTPLSTNMCSLTAETYSTIAILIIINELCKTYQFHASNSIKIINDNKEVIRRCNERPEIINANQTLVAEYDLWQLTHDLIAQIPITLKFAWQKGHQDELPNGQKIAGPFRRHAQINIEMDRMAQQKMEKHRNPFSTTHRRPMYKHTVINFYSDQGIQIGNIKQYILQTTNGPKLKKYIESKYGWTLEQQNTINWRALETVLKKQTSTRQTRLAQLMYNWQNVGTQKEKIDSSGNKCPTNCGEVETPSHYLQCSNKSMSKERQTKQHALLQQLDKIQTHPGIKTSMIHILNQEWTNITSLEGHMNSGDERLLKEAILSQLKLGQHSLEKGFLCYEWEKVQYEWMTLKNLHHKDRYQWSCKVITALQTYTLNVWKHRNTFIHGTNNKDNKEKQIQQCHKRIDDLYERKNTQFTIEQQVIFHKPQHLRKRQGLEAMGLWISTAELLLATKTNGDQKTLESCNLHQTKLIVKKKHISKK